MGCDVHGVQKFSHVVLVVPLYIPLRFGRSQKYPPVLMDSKDIYAYRYGSVMTCTI